MEKTRKINSLFYGYTHQKDYGLGGECFLAGTDGGTYYVYHKNTNRIKRFYNKFPKKFNVSLNNRSGCGNTKLKITMVSLKRKATNNKLTLQIFYNHYASPNTQEGLNICDINKHKFLNSLLRLRFNNIKITIVTYCGPIKLHQNTPGLEYIQNLLKKYKSTLNWK